MGRAFLRETFTERDGDVSAGVALTAYKADGTTPFDRTIYSSPTGSGTATLLTDSNGMLKGWIEGPQPVVFDSPSLSAQVTSEFARDWSPGALWATDMGAVGDGTTDDTAPLQRWLDRLAVLGVSGYLPKGTYLNTGLTHSRMLNLYGDGMEHSILELAGTVSSTTDHLTLTAQTDASGNGTRGLTIRDIKITQQAGGGGRHGLVFDTSTLASYFANASIERCWIGGGPNGRAIANTTNATAGVPMFDSRFVGNLIGGGAKLLQVADSIWWQHNLSYGANVGLEISTVNTGAAKWAITESTFVNVGGAIWGKSNFINLSILHNYFEQPSAMAGGAGAAALIYLNATTAADINGVKIEGNQFSPGPVGYGVTYCVRLHNTAGTLVGPNDYALLDSSQFGVRADSTCTGTVVLPGQRNTGGFGTLVSANGETDILDFSLDSGGEVTLAAAGAPANADRFDLGAVAMGMIVLGVTNVNTDQGVGFLHGASAAVSLISSTNLGGAGTGITIGANSGTGIALYWTGSTQMILNKSAAQRTVKFRIAPRFI